MRARLRAVPWTTVALVAAVAVGLGFRIWAMASSLGTLDSDEAVWGLMAQRTLHGHPEIFFWHQAYGGTQEVFALAAVFAVTGPSILAMRLLQIAFYAVAAVLVWRVGLRTVGEPAARVAAALFWVWPAYLVWRSTREYGFYGAALVLALLAVLLVLRLKERVTLRDAALLGLVCGLGLWATPQVGFVALPAVGWLVWRKPRVLNAWPAAVPAALLGAAPWIVWNLRHGWGSFHAQAAASNNGYVQRLHEFVATTLPTILGLRVPFSLDWVGDGRLWGRALTAVLIAGVLLLAWRRRGGTVEPLVVIALAYPFLYAVSPYAWLIADPRYMTLLAPIVALLLAYGSVGVRAEALLIAAGIALTAAALVPMERDRLPLPLEHGYAVPENIGPALKALDEAGATRVRAPYWTAYRLEFESGQRVLASPVTNVVRDEHADRLVSADPHPAWVFPRGQPLDTSHAPALLRQGYRRIEAGDWSVYVWPGF